MFYDVETKMEDGAEKIVVEGDGSNEEMGIGKSEESRKQREALPKGVREWKRFLQT